MKIISALLMTFVLLSCNRGEGEIVIVPQHYTGYIVIVYDQAEGQNPDYKDGKRIYRVPENGILKTRFSANPGWIGIPEFYYGEIASENKILFKPDPRSLPIDTVVANGGTAGSVKKVAGGEEFVRFLEYYIGNKEQIDAAKERVQRLDLLKVIE